MKAQELYQIGLAALTRNHPRIPDGLNLLPLGATPPV
jgi:hypothetical protein